MNIFTLKNVFEKIWFIIMNLLANIRGFSRKYPLVRGMAAYSVLWPSSCLCQQFIAKEKEINYPRVARFGLFGCFFVAPTLHTWLKIITKIWPVVSTRTAVIKAVVEQFTYAPFSISCFYFGMTLLEGEGVPAAVDEVKAKLLPTYKIGVPIWTTVQTVNHIFVPERNKVIFVGICSFLWTCFLSYMKQLDTKNITKVQ